MTPRVISVKPSDTLATARRALQTNRIHHLLVIDGERVVGVLSYRDLVRQKDDATVSAVMSRDVRGVNPWDTLKSAASMMIGRPHGCLPVIESGRVTGIITTTDLLRAVTAPARPA
ncbi:MAG TPA: CBS domain-containing protein [Thermoanaerobaculia bacterium]